MKPPSWGESFLVSTMATAVALRLQSVLRDVWQIRALPERVMEWLLLFVPLDLFELGLQRFGSSAKDVALLIGDCSGWAASCGCWRWFWSCR